MYYYTCVLLASRLRAKRVIKLIGPVRLPCNHNYTVIGLIDYQRRVSCLLSTIASSISTDCHLSLLIKECLEDAGKSIYIGD